MPQYYGDLISWGAIGARTVESQTHRQLSSGLSMPIGFKNGTGGSVQIAIDAIIAAKNQHVFLGIDEKGQTSVVKTSGNKYGHLILRGGKTGPNYDSKSVESAVNSLIENKISLPAYDQSLKASHLFNILDARGVISVAQRAEYIARIRDMVKSVGQIWLESQK